jgi:hypothetical protein
MAKQKKVVAETENSSDEIDASIKIVDYEIQANGVSGWVSFIHPTLKIEVKDSFMRFTKTSKPSFNRFFSDSINQQLSDFVKSKS